MHVWLVPLTCIHHVMHALLLGSCRQIRDVACPPAQAGRATGAFQAIPMVPSADEHLASALRRARRITPNSRLKNEAAKARNKAARQMDGAGAVIHLSNM